MDGLGISLQGGGECRMIRVRLVESSGLAMSITDVAATIEDLVILKTRPAKAGHGGRAIEIRSSTVSFYRVDLEDHREVGLAAFGSLVELSDLSVREVVKGVSPTGTAVASLAGSTVNVQRFEVSGGEVCGFQIDESSDLQLERGVVHDNGAGVNASAGYDRSRLSREVFYFDNEVDYDSSSKPTPSHSGLSPDL
jgi:hypothetical protein